MSDLCIQQKHTEAIKDGYVEMAFPRFRRLGKEGPRSPSRKASQGLSIRSKATRKIFEISQRFQKAKSTKSSKTSLFFPVFSFLATFHPADKTVLGGVSGKRAKRGKAFGAWTPSSPALCHTLPSKNSESSNSVQRGPQQRAPTDAFLAKIVETSNSA